MPGYAGDKKQVPTRLRCIEGQVRRIGLNRSKRPPTCTPSRLLKPTAADERLVTGAIDSAVMRLARLGLIGAVLLVALHAFLFASGEGHHGNPVPTSLMAEGSVQHDGVRTALWSSQAHDVADDCMPAIVGLGVLLLVLTGGQSRRPATVVLRSAAPVVAPPTPPPIVLGISRT
jgi:hypothetical protein